MLVEMCELWSNTSQEDNDWPKEMIECEDRELSDWFSYPHVHHYQ